MITFPVDDVPAVLDSKPRITPALEKMFDATVLTSSPLEHCIAEPDVRDTSAMNGLVMAVHLAFAEHRPLELSPDDVWLAILQGFSIHVSENAESLRARFVEFAGQRRLTVELGPGQPLSDAFGLFRDGLAKELNPGLVSALTNRFSTSTPVEHDAFVIASMSAFARYFDYELLCICGIPRVTLTGTADDWRAVRARFRVLAEYDLQWWAKRLDPVLDELVRTAEGQPNQDFWRAIIKPEQVYGGDIITGWLPRLFPYLQRKGVRFERNDAPTKGWEHAPVRPSELPRGLSTATIREYPDRLLTAVSGFFGVKQTTDGALAPHIGWAIAERPIDRLFTELATKMKVTARVAASSWLHEKMVGVPALLQAFSDRFGAAELFDGRLKLHAPPVAPTEDQQDVQTQSLTLGRNASGLIFGSLADGSLLVRSAHWDAKARQRVELILLVDRRDAEPPYRVVAHSLLEFYQRLASATAFPPWEETNLSAWEPE